MTLKRMNMPLAAGLVILITLLALIAVPGLFSPQNPYATETLDAYQDDSGNFKFMTPPFEPNEIHPWGTDEMGRDVVSLIVYGARLTIGISATVVFFRFALSLVAGVSAAFGSAFAQNCIRLSNIIFNFVPPLIICLIVLKIRFFESLPKALSFWMFVLILTLVGWARVAEIVQTRAEDILRQDFVRGEVAVGKSRLHIALTNVLPHISAEVVVMAFMEIAVVLGLLMQLGVFQVFIGNLRIVESSDQGIIVSKPMSFEPEWAAMMGASKAYLRTAPWLVYAPALAFFVSILGFNMFAEGLRKALQAQNSKMISHGRRYVAPIAGALVLAVVLSAAGSAFHPVIALPEGERVPPIETVGPGNRAAADWLENELASMGYAPLEGAYQHVYDFEPYWIARSARIQMGPDESALLKQGRFAIIGLGTGTYSGILKDGRLLDVIGMEMPILKERSILVLDGRHYTRSMLEEYILALKEGESMDKLQAVFVVHDSEALGSLKNIGQFEGGVPVAAIDSDWVLPFGDQASLDVECAAVKGPGINVFGVLGSDPPVSDEAIILGFEYNYDGPEAMDGVNVGLDIAKALAEHEGGHSRQVIIAFWDSHHAASGYGLLEYQKHPLYRPKDTAVYIDVSVETDKGQVLIDATHAPHTRFYAWSLTQRAEKIGRGIGLKFTGALTDERPDIFLRGPSCIQIQLDASGERADHDAQAVSAQKFAGFIFDLVTGGAY